MAAAMMVQQAAGGALLSPAAASFAWQAVAVAAPRVLTLMQSHNRHYYSSPSSTLPPLHLLCRRPSSSARAASRSRSMASYSSNKHTNSLLQNEIKVEEEKMRRNKELAMALMQDTRPTTGAGEEEVEGINRLLALLGVSDGNGKKGAEKALREHRSLVEKKKRALLVELLNDGDKDGHGRQEKTEELAATARQLRNALSGHDHQRKLQNLCTEIKTLRESVADERVQRMQSDTELKKLMDDMAAARINSESANALVKSIQRDVMEMNVSVELFRKKLGTLQESASVGTKESKSARGLLWRHRCHWILYSFFSIIGLIYFILRIIHVYERRQTYYELLQVLLLLLGNHLFDYSHIRAKAYIYMYRFWFADCLLVHICSHINDF